MDRYRMDTDVPLIRERGFHPEQLTEHERREFAERLREDEELHASAYGRGDYEQHEYGRGELEPRGRR
ncbi:MAG TPA: hypothetical protein VGB92_26220 [Longimicrobium sp.]|jgi:hypothetical protein